MKLGINTGYWSSGPPAGVLDQVAEAERLGFDIVRQVFARSAPVGSTDLLEAGAAWMEQRDPVDTGT